MEKERRKLDKQLDHALEKAKAAGHGQEVLETKIKVKIKSVDTFKFLRHGILKLPENVIKLIQIVSIHNTFRYKNKKQTQN